MQAIRKSIFKQFEPNTFIGGVASTINTASLLATKLQISVSRIRAFRVVGDNIEFNITGFYTVPTFGGTNVSDADQNITYYYDDAALATTLSYFCFRNCLNFIDFRFYSLNNIGNSAFSNTRIVNADLSSLSQSLGGEWLNMFQFCSELVTVNTGELTNTIGQSASLFRNCQKLTNVSTKIKYYGQMYRGSGLPGAYLYNEFVLELRGLAFLQATWGKVELPNCIKIINEEFIQTSGIRYLKEVILPKVVSIGAINGNGSAFRGQTSLELVDLRACKHFYGGIGNFIQYNFRDACKVGTIIKVHVFMSTSDNGFANEELLYIKNNRGGIVEFYDDNGIYVSTL
jgi:hypothetical protein